MAAVVHGHDHLGLDQADRFRRGRRVNRAVSAGRDEQDVDRAELLFLIELDEVAICHLGDLGSSLPADQKEQLGSVDVLLIPTGGHCTIDAAAAAETISLIEPKIVIPMHFGTDAGGTGLDSIDRFLKEMGIHEVEPQARLSVTKSNVPEATQVILLEARR